MKISLMAIALCSVAAWAGNGYLGVMLQSLDDDLKVSYAYEGEGVLINHIVPSSGADRAGLLVGDIITRINSEEVTKVHDVTKRMAETRSGDEVQIAVVRSGEPLEFVVQVSDDLALGRQPHVVRKWAMATDERPYMGINFEPLNTQLASFFEVPHGILVTQVFEESAAEKAGILAGDVLTAIDGLPLNEEHDLLKQLHEHQAGDLVNFDIVRKGKSLSLPLTLEKHSQDRGMRWLDESGKVFRVGPDQRLDLHRSLMSSGAHAMRINDDVLTSIKEQLGQLKTELEELRKELKERR